MSISESDKLDGLGVTNNGNTLALLISDHLDFENEHEHLFALQNKINSYIVFIEEKQYMQIENFNKDYADFIFEIAFKFSPTENCIKFLNAVQNQLADLKIKIQYEVA